MSCCPSFRSRLALAASTLVWTLGSLTLAHGQQPSPAASPADAAPAPPPAAPRHVSFFVGHTVLWSGRTAIVPFHANQPADADETFTLALSESGAVEILRPPKMLAGETTGFLRVRALRPGHLRLLVHGEAPLDIQIKNDPAGAALSRIDAESPRPHIVTPVPQAFVWGQFSVGVEVFDANPAPGAEPKVQLRLPGGKLLDPVAHTTAEQGPARHYQFDVPADELSTGRARFVAVSSPAGFSDVERLAKTPGSLYESDALELNVITPRPEHLWSGECEDRDLLGVTKDLYGPARPPYFGTKVPVVTPDPAASGGQTVACYSPDPVWSMPFIVKEPGEYQLMIQTRGDFAIGAFPTASLYLNNLESPAGSVRLAGAKYHRLPVGTPLHLDAGPELLTVKFRNDTNVGKEDRNLFLDRYELVRVGDSLPATVPAPKTATAARGPAVVPPVSDAPLPAFSADGPDFRPAIAYPANGASIYGADAVVARVPGGGIIRPAWVDLLVDGQPQGVRSQSPSPADPLLLPLIARQVSPGSHRLALRVADFAGHVTDSPAQGFNVLPAPPAVRGPYDRAVFLLDRLAFGPDPRELCAILTMNESAWLENRLNSGFDTPAEQTALRLTCRELPRIDDAYQTASRAISQWIWTENPVRARFTAWAENHFSTWVEKTRSAPKWREHLDFCRLGVAPFGDLLNASAHSPAMVVYLDQEKSYAKKLNENYAREIMELHTLGVHGGYAQSDVTTLAGVLNGWTISQEGILPDTDGSSSLVYNGGNDSGVAGVFRFDPLLNDGKARRVFGLEFPAAEPGARYDLVRLAMEMLVSHPGTAEHVCRKLAEHYVGVPADDTLVHSLAQTYLENGGDMRPVMHALASSPVFWNSAPKMASPLDYGLRIARLCREAVLDLGGTPAQVQPRPDQIAAFLKKSGMGLFERVTPDGYPENSAAYMDSNALLQRWHFMESMVDPLNRLVPPDWRKPPAPAILPAANEGPGEDTAQRFIDLAAVRLTGRLLAPGSNQAAREILGDGTPDQLRQTLLLISLLPETSLR